MRFKIEATPPDMKYSACQADGTCGPDSFLFRYDGRKYKVPPTIGAYFTYRKLDDGSVEEKDYIGDGSQLRETDTWVVAGDGKTMTARIQLEASPVLKNPKVIDAHFDRQVNGPWDPKDPFVGHWVQDIEKSTPYTETMALQGDVIESTSSYGSELILTCDGKDHPLDGEGMFDTVNFRQEADKTILEYKERGKTVVKYVNDISVDGETRICIGQSADGRQLSKMTFERTK